MSAVFSVADDPVEAEQRALETLRKGGILLFPTDTVYGLGADSRCPGAVERLYKAKGRPRGKPFQWLVADAAFAREMSGEWNEMAEKLAKAFWPGPLTLVVTAKEGSIGWRVPRHDWLLSLLRKLGRPLVATSANRSGHPPRCAFKAVCREFLSVADVAVDGGILGRNMASTVVFVESGKARILRQGAISRVDILRALK